MANSLIKKARQFWTVIKNETGTNKNTADRVGSAGLAILDAVEYGSPYIGKNGNWFVQGEDTGVKAGSGTTISSPDGAAIVKGNEIKTEPLNELKRYFDEWGKSGNEWLDIKPGSLTLKEKLGGVAYNAFYASGSEIYAANMMAYPNSYQYFLANTSRVEARVYGSNGDYAYFQANPGNLQGRYGFIHGNYPFFQANPGNLQGQVDSGNGIYYPFFQANPGNLQGQVDSGNGIYYPFFQANPGNLQGQVSRGNGNYYLFFQANPGFFSLNADSSNGTYYPFFQAYPGLLQGQVDSGNGFYYPFFQVNPGHLTVSNISGSPFFQVCPASMNLMDYGGNDVATIDPFGINIYDGNNVPAITINGAEFFIHNYMGEKFIHIYEGRIKGDCYNNIYFDANYYSLCHKIPKGHVSMGIYDSNSTSSYYDDEGVTFVVKDDSKNLKKAKVFFESELAINGENSKFSLTEKFEVTGEILNINCSQIVFTDSGDSGNTLTIDLSSAVYPIDLSQFYMKQVLAEVIPLVPNSPLALSFSVKVISL